MKQTIIIRGAASLSAAIQKLSGIPLNKPWVLTVEEMQSTRSIEQNRRYWAVLTDIADQLPDETGKFYSPETWHEWAKAKFLGKDTIIIDGEPTLVQRTTTKLKVLDFVEYCTQIEVWAIDHGVNFYRQGAA